MNKKGFLQEIYQIGCGNIDGEMNLKTSQTPIVLFLKSHVIFALSFQDKDFGKAALHRAHSNPSAEVSATIKIYQTYTIQRAYLGETFFWGLIPKAKDTVTFKFNPPIAIQQWVKTLNIQDDKYEIYNVF